MTHRLRRTLGTPAVSGAAVATAGLGAGTALAAPSAASGAPTADAAQAADAVHATAREAQTSLGRGLSDRAESVDGVETEFPGPDAGGVEGPLGGLLDGPVD